MATINPYITFNGTCEAAFNFYKSVFGTEFSYVGRFGDMPANDEFTISDAQKDKIMHVSLPINPYSILMGSDSSESWGAPTIVGDNISISINVLSKDEADNLFNGLSEGGKVSMKMEYTFWGAYFGMLTDQFGINWMINFDEEPKK